MWVGKQLRKLANFAGIASLLVMWFWEEMMVPLIIMFLYIWEEKGYICLLCSFISKVYQIY